MMFNRFKVISLPLLFCGLAQAQAPATAPAKPDSSTVKALIEKTRKAGGGRWQEAVHFFCEAPRANSAGDPLIEATKIFDNVYVIGNQGTVAYVIQTSAGLLMIDSLGADQMETQLLPGFRKLGLNPADVKVIVMGHGHADHFGGSPYMQDHFGSKVYISAADWNFMENPPPAQAKKGPPPVLPMWLFPWLSYVAIAGMIAVLIAMAITPSHFQAFWTSVVSVVVALLAYVVLRRGRGTA